MCMTFDFGPRMKQSTRPYPHDVQHGRLCALTLAFLTVSQSRSDSTECEMEQKSRAVLAEEALVFEAPSLASSCVCIDPFLLVD